MSLQETVRSERLHIGIFGKVNSGKSTLLNMMSNQTSALVSKQAGTTTDPVYKAMELAEIGPVVFIDTAGFEDVSTLGEKRLEKTRDAALKCDIAIVLFGGEDSKSSLSWLTYFEEHKTPTLLIVNTYLQKEECAWLHDRQEPCLHIDVKDDAQREVVRKALLSLVPTKEEMFITANIVQENDVVLLVMPQDMQAPKGRLILPQVQTIRELLDKKCMVISCGVENMKESLDRLKEDPDVIICDSQVFEEVYQQKPKASKLTSFSVLFAQYKGDIQSFIEGAKAISKLNEESRVLIAEACTHAPLSEDIGREKIPMLLRKKIGKDLHIDVVSGNDFPNDLTQYDIIIHCGACMFNRKYVMTRIEQAKKAGVAITNYGICIAYLKGVLDKIEI